MSRMEQESRKRRKKQNLQRALLFTLATAGIVAWAVMAPNTLRLLKYLPGDPIRYRLRTAAGKLVAKGYAVWIKREGAYCLRLTEKGHKALALEQSVLSLNSPKRTWDGQWRIVTFDVPERRRGVRGRLRMMMKSVGFIRLQESVWVYPYDCEEFMALLKAELKIGRNVLYVIADSIEQDSALRKHFSLPFV
ncbi:MAG: CRISPR-associated endonuclease Cas2 [Patescibacteria group bacterium]